jgi:hypothetical protein
VAIKITRVTGIDDSYLLIPTTKEVNHRISTKLAELEGRTAPLAHATTERTYGVATAAQYGHVKITADIDNAADDVAIIPAAVKQQLTILEGKVTNAISDKIYFGAYWFAKTKPDTDLTNVTISPTVLSATLSITQGNISLIDFISNTIYIASYDATTWGQPALQLDIPANGTTVGVTGYFLDISENTEILKLSGKAVYSTTKSRWDIYPDKQGGIDNYTIVKNLSGLDSIANYYVHELSPDETDYPDGDTTTRNYFEWLTSFYRKIKGLHSINDSKISKTTTINTLYGTDDSGNQSNLTYTATEFAPGTIVQRMEDGNILVPPEQEGPNQAISNTRFINHTSNNLLHKTTQEQQKLDLLFLPTVEQPGEVEHYLSQTGVYKPIQHQSLEDYATKQYTEEYANSVTQIATLTNKGTVKSSNGADRVKVLPTGEMEVASFDIYKMYQKAGDTIVFAGGDAEGQLIIQERAY